MYYHYQARNKDAPLEPPRRHCWVQIVCNSVSQCQMKDATMVDNPGSWLLVNNWLPEILKKNRYFNNQETCRESRTSMLKVIF